MKPFQRILSIARPHQRFLWGSMFFNILYSLLQIASIGTLLPILSVMFGTVEKVDTSKVPVWSGRIADYFGYVKDWAYYTIQYG